MKDVIVIAIWELAESVVTRSVVVDNKTKELKMNGRKPNKLIIPESLIDMKLLRKVKSIGSYNCKVVRAIGK